MVKSDIYFDTNFRIKCSSYGLNWQKFNLWNGVITIESPKKGIYILVDEQYNVMNIVKADSSNSEKTVDEYMAEYTDVNESDKYSFPYPFQKFSIKQIYDIANRVSIHETNNGHSSDMFVNGKLVEDEIGNIYLSLLYYISFIGEQINQYYRNLYQMKMMDFDYPNIYTYIKSITSNIEECINRRRQSEEQVMPVDIIDYLGQDRKLIDRYSPMLYNTIRLFDKVNEDKTINLESAANDLLKLLEISDEEVERRYIEGRKNMSFDKINLQSYLSEKKEQVLVKSKKDK